jgi:hypothetical protein
VAPGCGSLAVEEPKRLYSSSDWDQLCGYPHNVLCASLPPPFPLVRHLIDAKTLSNILFDLAPRPEYIAPLRQEVEDVINEYGWTKDAMGHMRKLDSFMRESSRYGGISASTLLPYSSLSNELIDP